MEKMGFVYVDSRLWCSNSDDDDDAFDTSAVAVVIGLVIMMKRTYN